MQIKAIKPIHFLYFETETVVNELINFTSRIPKALHLEAVKLGLDITGPVYWNYFGFTGDGTKPFKLEIAIPVAEYPESYSGSFRTKRTGYFKCLSAIHEGSWYDLPGTYGAMMQYVLSHQLQLAFENREVYINCDFHDPEANVTEIQIGIH